MRRLIPFSCEGARLGATLDEGAMSAGLLIVSGGNEIRMGAHRGMAMLAAKIAASGHPVFRFDRRGIGDSEDENGGFLSSKSDISAAIDAFRAACPHITKIVAFGNCDAATALVLHQSAVNALVLANPWVIEPLDDLPPAAAIKDHYAKRLRDPKAWLALFTGKLNVAAALRGIKRIAAPPKPVGSLSAQIAEHLASETRPVHILAASGDNTAIAFLDAWRSDAFAAAHNRPNFKLTTIDSSSHSFASAEDMAVLGTVLLDVLSC